MKSNRDYISEYNQLMKACDAVYHAAAARMGLSDCAFWILCTLQNTDMDHKQSDICDSGYMPRQTVNSALKKLEKDGYVTLHRVEGRMGKFIKLTEEGSQFVQENIRPVMEAEEKVSAMFSDEEKEAFFQTFHALVENLQREIAQAETGVE